MLYRYLLVALFLCLGLQLAIAQKKIKSQFLFYSDIQLVEMPECPKCKINDSYKIYRIKGGFFLDCTNDKTDLQIDLKTGWKRKKLENGIEYEAYSTNGHRVTRFYSKKKEFLWISIHVMQIPALLYYLNNKYVEFGKETPTR